MPSLEPVELVVESSGSHQLCVGARFLHPSSVDHGYQVRVVDGGQPVSDDDTGAPLPGFVQSFLDHLLTLSVQGRGGLVKEEDLGVPDQRSGDGDALLLPAAQLRPFAYIGAVALSTRERIQSINKYTVEKKTLLI